MMTRAETRNTQTPGREATTTRRQFISAAASCASIGVVAATASQARAKPADIKKGGSIDWGAVRSHYELAEGTVPMNAANMTPPAKAARLALAEATRSVDRDPSFENRDRFKSNRQRTRESVARLIGADVDEIALTRNTSESNNTVVQGINLRPGDEVVLWDQNHPTNRISWQVRAKREGFTVKLVSTPDEPKSPEDMVAPFRNAITGKTRVVAASHISNVTGAILPAREICSLAREAGAISLMDGAQTCGAKTVDVHEIGCDFYTSSGQKWLTGPREAGLLYVRRERIEEFWPLIVGSTWPKDVVAGARKFESLGQRDDGAIAGLGAAAEFLQGIGVENIEERIRSLGTRLMARITTRVPDARLATPSDPERRLSIVALRLPVDADHVRRLMYHEYGISCAVYEQNPARIRLCPHLYTTEDDIERSVHALTKLS